ncbi:DegT/DnrJ/EryC1/StrS family aminotransferase [Streptomyces sp. NPDC059009]|uniref:DegT/DnrJ/EryC1/StrS family aminotransferase n=1 Tax=Streptomyces sp. NPDC059009 TaxID=3346694 RepID=UPI0036C07D90
MTRHIPCPDAARHNAIPFLHGAETAAISQALLAGQYGHGELTEEFERRLAAFLGVADVVAVASGTAALHIALLTAGVGPGDEVIVPSQTYCATIHAIVACGAHPRFIDIKPDTLCIDAATVLAALTPHTRAVLPVLYGGRAIDLTGIQDRLATRGITVVEDAAHAFGSHTRTTLVGASSRALTCFSFGPIKNLTCGQGGAIVPRSPEQAHTARSLRALGITQSQQQRAQSTTYTVERVGLRATMSALNASIGLVQLERFPLVAAKRQVLWRAYAAALAELDDVVLVDVDVEHTVPFNCVVRLKGRERVFHLLRDRGIGVGVHYPPNHLQPAFHRWHRHLPATEETGTQIMSLPFHPAMTDDDINFTVSALQHAVITERSCAS